MSKENFASPQYRVALHASNPRRWNWLPVVVGEMFRDGDRDQIKEGLASLIYEACVYYRQRFISGDADECWHSAFAYVGKNVKSDEPFGSFAPRVNIGPGMAGKDVFRAVAQHVEDAVLYASSGSGVVNAKTYGEIIETLAEAIVEASQIE